MKKEFDLNLIAAPQFTCKLPSSGKEIRLRSLVMKEYKNLFIAREGDNLVDTVEQLLSSAVQTDVNIFDLPIGDIEYIFLQLYMASSGKSQIPIAFKCTNENDGKKCNNRITAHIDLNSAFVPSKDINLYIPVNDMVTIEMRQPTTRDFDKHDITKDKGLMECVLSCIKNVHVNDVAYTSDELGTKLSDILDNVTGEVFGKMVEVITETPRITTIVNVKCNHCGQEHMVPITGLDDFFL